MELSCEDSSILLLKTQNRVIILPEHIPIGGQTQRLRGLYATCAMSQAYQGRNSNQDKSNYLCEADINCGCALYPGFNE